MEEHFNSAESLENFIQIDCPDKQKLLEYLQAKRAAAFLLDGQYQLHIGLHGNHAPIIERLHRELGSDYRILEKGQISPLKNGVTFETSSPETTMIELSGKELAQTQQAIRSKITNYLGSDFKY
jgi:superfamily I DNA and/or RNA helicase